ncbi:hypothetical protein GC163_07230 [bacterium]|nr:hypothetical protein [bacterium]
MTRLATYPQPANSLLWAKPQIGQRPTPSAGPVTKLLAFLLGATLPIITLEQNVTSTSGALTDRVVLADFMAIGFLVLSGLKTQLQFRSTTVLYLGALLYAFSVAMLRHNDGDTFIEAAKAFLAIGFAVAFVVAGATAAMSEKVLYWLTLGALLGLFGELLIAAHDFLLPSNPWFVDAMERRVRGTFKKSGQLASYGFSAVVFLGATYKLLSNRKFLGTLILAGVMAGCFILVASTRRSALVGVVAMMLTFLVIGTRFAKSRLYQVSLASVVAGGLFLLANLSGLSDSFVMQRYSSAFNNLDSSDNWLMVEVHNAYDTSDAWFPFGIGLGQGFRIGATGEHEIHNGHLAMMVEGGLPLYFCTLALILYPAWISLKTVSSPRSDIAAVILVAIFVGAVIFMGHNRVYRDRMFMLAAGVGTVAAMRFAAAVRTNPSTPLGQNSGGRPKLPVRIPATPQRSRPKAA